MTSRKCYLHGWSHGLMIMTCPSQASSSLRVGKHVLVEKPLYKFESLMKEAMEFDRVLMVGFHRRHDPEFQRAKDIHL